MEEKMRPLIISLTITLTLFLAGADISSGEDAGPFPAATSTHSRTVLSQATTEGPQTPAQSITTTTDTRNVPVTEVEVKAKKAKEGSAEAGYKIEGIRNVGSLGEMKLQDTPYSISVMPQELIQNLQGSMPDSLFRVNPFTQVNQPQARGSQSFAMMRGFRVDNFQALENGMLISSSLMNMEDKERVEILTGLSGFLYGPASPGGTLNYVLKSPTFTPFANITAGNYGGSTRYVHGDLGGPIYKDKLAYRLNVVAHEGDTAVDYQSIKRYLASGALDWRVASNVLLQFDAAHDQYRIDGLVPMWQFSSGVRHPSAPDAEKLWAQKFGFTKEERTKVGGKLTWDLSDIFTLRSGFGYESLTREATQFRNAVTSNNGSYSEVMTAWAPWKYDVTAGYAALDSKFKTGPVAHKVTAGFFGRELKLREYQDYSANVTLAGSFNFSDPVYVAEPNYSTGNKRLADSSLTKNKNFFIGDTVAFSDAWSALAGLNYAQIITRSYNLDTGATKATYDKSEVVPSLSLIYKPISQVSTYATYTEGLEKGGTAPTTAANANEVMPPMLSKQYEVGAKATLGNMFLTLALFRIEKAFEYTDASDNTYKQDGRQVHKGLEFSATGKVTRNLTLLGGFTLMQARVEKNASNTSLEGKTPVDVAEQMVKLYAEYDIDAVPGLTLTGGAYYTGQQAADNLNKEYLPAVITADLGARYQMKVYGNYPLILRLNVTNITNESYWLNSSYTGDPRTFLFSAQIKF